MGRESAKRDGRRGTNPPSPSCDSRLGSTASPRGAFCPPWAPSPGPRVRDRPRDASYPAARGASGHSVGAAKAAAPCRASGPRLGPRPPPGRRLEAGRTRHPPKRGTERSRRGPTRLHGPSTKGKCRQHPGFVRAQRAEQRRGSSRLGVLPAGLTPYSQHTLECGRAPSPRQWRARLPAALCPARRVVPLCVTGRGEGGGGPWTEALLVCVVSSRASCTSHLAPTAAQGDCSTLPYSCHRLDSRAPAKPHGLPWRAPG